MDISCQGKRRIARFGSRKYFKRAQLPLDRNSMCKANATILFCFHTKSCQLETSVAKNVTKYFFSSQCYFWIASGITL